MDVNIVFLLSALAFVAAVLFAHWASKQLVKAAAAYDAASDILDGFESLLITVDDSIIAVIHGDAAEARERVKEARETFSKIAYRSFTTYESACE